jgi:hypothetical protein
MTNIEILANPPAFAMKRFSDLFRSKKREPERPTPVSEALLADLEAESSASALGFRWVPLNRADDLCDRAGDRDRALTYYGRAIDVMLETGSRSPPVVWRQKSYVFIPLPCEHFVR